MILSIIFPAYGGGRAELFFAGVMAFGSKDLDFFCKRTPSRLASAFGAGCEELEILACLFLFEEIGESSEGEEFIGVLGAGVGSCESDTGGDMAGCAGGIDFVNMLAAWSLASGEGDFNFAGVNAASLKALEERGGDLHRFGGNLSQIGVRGQPGH